MPDAPSISPTSETILQKFEDAGGWLALKALETHFGVKTAPEEGFLHTAVFQLHGAGFLKEDADDWNRYRISVSGRLKLQELIMSRQAAEEAARNKVTQRGLFHDAA